MLHELLLWSLVGQGLVKGTLLCPDNHWNLFESKCYKITDDVVSYDEGKAKCMNENLHATLMMPKTTQEAQIFNSTFANYDVWLGLRFYMGSVWMWEDYTEYEASGSITWENGRPFNPPHLCNCIFEDGHMCDWDCMKTSGVVCQRDLEFCPTDSAWIQNVTMCYIMLIHRNNGVTYKEAKERCRNINGTVIMPKTEADANWIAMSLIFGTTCGIGLVDYDADYVYTWEEGTNEKSSDLYWKHGLNQQPNGRDKAYLCTVMRNGEMYDVDCSTTHRGICQVNGTTISSSLTSQTAESDYDTKLQTVQHESSTQTATLILNTSTIGKDNCKSKSNGCQCQKKMSTTTESVKTTDYIWIRKCEVQPLIDSGVLKVIDCLFTCSCSSRYTNEAISATHEMFVCIKRR